MADTNTNEMKIVFTIADLASSKIDEINKKWDTMRTLIGENKDQTLQLGAAVEKIDSGNQMLKLATQFVKIAKYLYNARSESSKLENGFKKLGVSVQDVASIKENAFKLSGETGIPVEQILSSALKIKSSFKDLNAVNLNAMVGAVTNNVLATGNSFDEVTNQIISAGKSVQGFKGDLNQLNFGNIDDFAKATEALDRSSTQFGRISNAWENFKKHLGSGIENSALVKFGILESALSKIFRFIAGGIETLNVFLMNNPKLLEFAGNFTTLGIAVLYGIGAFSAIKGGILALRTIAPALFTLKGALAALRIGFSLLASAIAANPVGLIIVGIVAGAALIITYWDEIKAATLVAVDYILEKLNSFVDFLTSAWDTVKGAWMEMPDWAKGLVAVIAGVILGPITLFLGLFAGIGLTIYNYWDDIVNLASSIAAYISNLWNILVAGVVGFGSLILENLNQFWNSFLSIGPWLMEQFNAIWNGIWNAIPESAKTAGWNLMKALGNGILAGLNFITRPIKEGLGFIGSFLPGGSKQDQGPLGKLLGFKNGPSPNSSPAPGLQNNVKVPPASKQISVPGLQLKIQTSKQPGITLDQLQTQGINAGGLSTNKKSRNSSLGNLNEAGISSERPKKNPVLQRFNETIDSDSKRVVRRTSETSEVTEMGSGRKQNGSSLSIGSIIGQLVVGDRTNNKKKIGEIITDAIFQELDRFEEMELA
ncbi:hypothetical protein EHQ76_14070 [Leptospira barantonii]|uniref:Phage tail tape measure protein n=1 Tax=Leptospira barantonii TaxID=2023184 RepID=A0A5F2B0I5_9LEPT|nr:hypothetical protein [Leptospira barantonii]TGL97970.1 hypothetical protein EHQ76_14070 [Leptospira barantonii]